MRNSILQFISWETAVVVLFITGSALANDTIVRNADDIEDAMQTAQPGDTLTMANGVWTDQEIRFQGEGTAENPILLRAETPGSVVLNGESKLNIAGKWLVVDGLRFVNGYSESGDVIQFRVSSAKAYHCRLTNTAVINFNPPVEESYKWVSMYGTHNRVDHCYFRGKQNEGALLVIWADAQPDSHLIDHNYFGVRPPLGRNGAEIIRIGTSDWSMFDSNSIVEFNYFEECDGEIEIISNKTGGNIFRYNTFYDNEGMLTLRHGNRAEVYGNFFFGNQNPLAGGVRIIGEDHKVYNNYFEGLYGTGLRSALPIMNGVPNSPLNRYFQVKRATVAFNTFVDCKSSIVLGAGADSERSLPPLDNVIANNVVLAEGHTIVSQEDEPINLVWEGNIFQGDALGIPQPDGITLTDPKLGFDMTDSLWRPADDSPLISAAVGDYAYVGDDMDGQARDVNKDVGADEASDIPITRRPLKAGDVGPGWKSNDNMVSLAVKVVGSGSVQFDPPGGLYEIGTEVTLTATPESDIWKFAGWSGDIVTTDNPTTITVNDDMSITATFTSPPIYVLAAWKNGSGQVSFDPPGGEYFEGTTVRVTATPVVGWLFSHWEGDLSGSENPDSLVMDRRKLVIATFVEADSGGGQGGVLEVSADDNFKAAFDSAFAAGIDTLMLTTSGGLYTTDDPLGIEIIKPITILAAPGLEEKPVLTNSDVDQNILDILRVYDDLTVEGVAFDGGHESSHGMKYAVRVQPSDERGLVPRTGVNVALLNCDFYNFYQNKDPNADGHALRVGTGAVCGDVRIENCTFKDFGYEAIRISDTEKFATERAVESLIVRNCTFVNIDAECIRFYADLDDGTRDANVLIEHLTIYNSATRVAYLKNNKNSIFRNIIIANSRQSGHNRDDDLFEVQSTGSVSSHIDTFQVKRVDMEAPKGGAVVQNTIYGFDPMFADPENGDFTLAENSPAFGKAHDGSALGDLRWAGTPTAVHDDQTVAAMPTEFILEQNYPNPFNPSTTIQYNLAKNAFISLEIFDLNGGLVEVLVNENQAGGAHRVSWQAENVAAGIYFYTLKVDGRKVGSRKLLLVK